MVKRKKPAPKKPPPKKRYVPAWKDPRVRLELFIAPNLALKLGLPRHIVEKTKEPE